VSHVIVVHLGSGKLPSLVQKCTILKGTHGKGSASGKTTVQDLKREIPTGTLRAMIEQLELDAEDFGLR